nr:MAG TPA_asm: hypothetical protein [Caudoviricetes sp.]
MLDKMLDTRRFRGVLKKRKSPEPVEAQGF